MQLKELKYDNIVPGNIFKLYKDSNIYWVRQTYREKNTNKPINVCLATGEPIAVDKWPFNVFLLDGDICDLINENIEKEE